MQSDKYKMLYREQGGMPMKRASLGLASLLSFCAAVACGGGQQQPTHFETRPLGETEALEIIREVLAERGYTETRQVDVALTNSVKFSCDVAANDHPIGIEYVIESDRQTMGAIPPPAGGSRLHVLRGQTISTDSAVPGAAMYVFFVDSRNFVYHFNPTSEVRANVTFLDVDARLRRDLADFLSWYEKDIAKR
jgi:hypothetical protein